MSRREYPADERVFALPRVRTKTNGTVRAESHIFEKMFPPLGDSGEIRGNFTHDGRCRKSNVPAVAPSLSQPNQEVGGTVAFGAYGNGYSWTLPQVGQVTLAFSSICSLLWSAIPSRKAVNVGPQSLQRSSVFSSAIVVLSRVDAKRGSAQHAERGVKICLMIFQLDIQVHPRKAASSTATR